MSKAQVNRFRRSRCSRNEIHQSSHLYYLFVAKPYQGSGLAKRLWQRVKEDAQRLDSPDRFTVNALLSRNENHRTVVSSFLLEQAPP